MKAWPATLIPAICLAFAACGGSPSTSSPPSSTAQPSAAETARAGPVRTTSNVPAAFAPLWIALDKGYFKDAGVDVSFQPLGQGANAAILLANGQLDFVPTGIAAADFNGVSRGVDNKIVSSLGCVPLRGLASAIMVRKDLADSGQVRSAADLKGRKVALAGGTAGAPAYEIAAFLHTAGLTLKDVEVVNVPSTIESVTAFKNGGIDASYITVPFTTEVAREGTGVVLSPPVRPGHCPTATLFSSKFITEQPDQSKAVMVGLVRAARDLQGASFKSDANVAIISKYTKLSPEAVRAMDVNDFRPDLAPDAETVLDMQSVYMAEGQLSYSTPLPAERLIDPSFAKYAADKLGPFKP